MKYLRVLSIPGALRTQPLRSDAFNFRKFRIKQPRIRVPSLGLLIQSRQLRAAWETYWVPQTALLGDAEDMMEIAEAVRKIQRNSRELTVVRGN